MKYGIYLTLYNETETDSGYITEMTYFGTVTKTCFK